jgi:beta-glucanase (GH16 family)
MKKSLILILLFGLAFTACKEETVPPVTLPTNLTMTITKSASVEGKVEVVAKADNENYFTITFEDGNNTETIEEKSGLAEHTYSASGTYTIIVKAHLTPNLFTEIQDTVSVTVVNANNGIPTTGFSTPLSYNGYNLVWQDEFSGTSLNTDDWNYELGTGNNGWGNNELQYYRKENTSVSDGYLTITAKKQSFVDQGYTSSRLTTQNKKSFKYGRVDIRAALPKGQGLWPALWMLGDNISSVGWPRCGEIDIMEIVGGTAAGKSDKRTFGTLHWDNNGEYASTGGNTTTSQDNFSNEFHVFSIIWEADNITWLLDDREFHEIDISPSHMDEFRDDFFFIFNVAVGGNWPGSPDASTQFPQKMHVDYIRVFQKK